MIVWPIGYVLSIVLANVAILVFGVVPVWPGILAPAAVYFVGVSLLLRDMVQEYWGKTFVVYLILVAAALSALFNLKFALASGVAFFASEMLDLAVYTPLRRHGFAVAALASNAVGLVVDSVVFLTLAFGSLQFLPGQILGKTFSTVIAVMLVVTWRNRAVLSRGV